MNATTDCAPMLTIYTREGKNGTNIANAEYAGTIYEITSRQSAVFKLCRDISEAGAEDCAFQVINKMTGTIGYSGLSWRFLAGLTVVETDTHGPRLAKFEAFPEKLTKGRKTGHPLTAPATASARGADGHCAAPAIEVAPHPHDAASNSRVTQETGVIDAPIPRREYVGCCGTTPAEEAARKHMIAAMPMKTEADRLARQRVCAGVDIPPGFPRRLNPAPLTRQALQAALDHQATQGPPAAATPCSLDTSPLELDVISNPVVLVPFDAPGMTLDDLLSA